VLLKNEPNHTGRLLPLNPDSTLALIGRFARTPRYQGAGSSLINPTRLDNLYDEMVALDGNRDIVYAPGYPAKGDQIDRALIEAAVQAAQAADVAVVCAGLTNMHEVEGLDRKHLRLPASHDALIEAVTAVQPNTVVVLSNGAPVEMPWVAQAPAIVEGYLGGQAGAGALADVLCGVTNPNGKLAETFPLRLEDNPSHCCFPAGPSTVEYRESIYVGYRYYETAEREVLFPFGHGLSYTTFAYRDLVLDRATVNASDTLTVRVTVHNTGERAGKEVIQLYVRDVESTAFRPDKELKGFDKVALEPGEAREITFELGRRAFAAYDAGLGDWHVESGDFEILIGASCRDIRLSATVYVESDQGPASPVDGTQLAQYYTPPRDGAFERGGFRALLDRDLPDNIIAQPGHYTLNTPISDMQGSWVGRKLAGYMEAQVGKLITEEEGPTALLMEAVMREAPLRIMLMASDGRVSRSLLDALLKLINGHYLTGLVGLVRSMLGR
jgi:beta-glucosidase